MSNEHEKVSGEIVYKYTCPFCGEINIDTYKITHCKGCNRNIEIIINQGVR